VIGPVVAASATFAAVASLAVVRAVEPQASDPAAILESAYADRDFTLTADPAAAEWAAAPKVFAALGYTGQPAPGRPMEIRSRWTTGHLYLLFACPYDELNLKPDPALDAETPRLWNWDVAEAFIGSVDDRIGVYKEFQVSPQGEWVDLAIDRDSPKTQGGMAWNSGFVVKARVDAAARVWYGEMRIPLSAIEARPVEQGREFRLGLFRLAGPADRRVQYLWRPSGQSSFHVPQAFGRLRLR
jgi:hypothetical protein